MVTCNYREVGTKGGTERGLRGSTHNGVSLSWSPVLAETPACTSSLTCEVMPLAAARHSTAGGSRRRGEGITHAARESGDQMPNVGQASRQ